MRATSTSRCHSSGKPSESSTHGSRSKPPPNKRKEGAMAPTESDPITLMIRQRSIQAAQRLAPACTEILKRLDGSSYAEAMEQLAELQQQAEHTKTLISILRDWQAANAAEKSPEKS